MQNKTAERLGSAATSELCRENHEKSLFMQNLHFKAPEMTPQIDMDKIDFRELATLYNWGYERNLRPHHN